MVLMLLLQQSGHVSHVVSIRCVHSARRQRHGCDIERRLEAVAHHTDDAWGDVREVEVEVSRNIPNFGP